MPPTQDPGSLDRALAALGSGLPVLLVQFAATLVLLAIGAAIYFAITPFHERRLVAQGNVAAGIVLAGTLVALAMPLAVTLATSRTLLDILVWGAVALVLQLGAFAVSALAFRDLRGAIEAGNAAAAASLVGVQIAVALLNAGAMAG
jgi:putative membrane protein